MRRFVFFIVIICLLFIIVLPEDQNMVAEEEALQVIPDEAIRLRILANSDDGEDQHIKYKIRDQVVEQIDEWVGHMTNIDEARQWIQDHLGELEEIIQHILMEENDNHTFTVTYDQNVTFPAKMYDSYIYPPGEYEAILITIGEGQGANWWCVLFPPLCFLDFSNGGLVADATDDHQDEELLKSEEEETQKKSPLKIKFFLFEWLGWT